ncbi:hypothetical protein V6x_38280 [Gimesia chilikensis]|uniref:DUF899 domain-containing protein n=1 Tax=Gimesia chilikensis TaxID=2605989 RepID=A0A517WFU9_9PLAN|nr:DUF899 domain-containing protein [Gimesia chilikensis]QDU04103.1 hypothetical protein V6x_38280 [Gimesia chilikensis]
MNSTEQTLAHPDVVTHDAWLTQRLELLAAEKELTRYRDRVNAQRRRLPMVKLEKDYQFAGPDGKLRLLDLFAGRRQLIVYHFMFAPEWEQGCQGCTMLVNSFGDLSLLNKRGTTFVLVSRAPLEKLQKYKAEQGWGRTWVSSFESDFNYDFHVTLDGTVAPPEYNYRSQKELQQRKDAEPFFLSGELHGVSVFFRVGDDVYHTYSTYARGCESLTDSFRLLDLTPYGRQEEFEDSPAGWPQKPTYG